MISITLLNEKGGVGKTTLATHLAAGLAILGMKVLLVDTDPQGNATTAFGLSEEPGLYNLLVRRAAFKEVLRPVSPEVIEYPEKEMRGMMAVVPGNIETRNIANSIQDALTVRRRFQELRNTFDVVVYDTSPTPSLLHGSIFLATDFVIYPTKLEAFSLEGLVASLEHMEGFRQEKRGMNLGDVESLAIVPMIYRGQTVSHSENLKELQSAYGVWSGVSRDPDQPRGLVWPELYMRTSWNDAADLHRPVWQIDPKGKATEEIWGTVERLAEELYVRQ